MKSESTQDGLRAALEKMRSIVESGGLDALTALDDPLEYIEPLWTAVTSLLDAALTAQPEPPTNPWVEMARAFVSDDPNALRQHVAKLEHETGLYIATEPPAEDTEYGFDRTKEHSEHFGAPPTENTVEVARAAVRDAIARFPGAIPVSALATAEAAIRADERSKAEARLRDALERIERFTRGKPLDFDMNSVHETARAALSEVQDERAKAQAEAPTRAENAQVGTAIRAAFDGAPAAPSEAVVERAVLVSLIEDVLQPLSLIECDCDEGYTSRGRHEPNAFHSDYEDVINGAREAIAALSEEA